MSSNSHPCRCENCRKRHGRPAYDPSTPVMSIIPSHTPKYSAKIKKTTRAHGGFIDTRDIIPAAAPQLYEKNKADKSITFTAAVKETYLLESAESICFQVGFASGEDDRKILTDEKGSSFRIQVNGTYRIAIEGNIIMQNDEAVLIFQVDNLNEAYEKLTQFDIPKSPVKDQFTPINISTILPLEKDARIDIGFISGGNILLQSGTRIQIYKFS